MSEKTGGPSMTERLEAALVEEIATGQIAPGERLDESVLAQRFGMSRTPVREALNRLVAQGILVPGEKRGVRVAEYTHEELAQIFEAMHEIEAVCAQLAAKRLSLLSRARIETAQAGCLAAAEQGDIPAYLRANEALHMAIYDATENPFIKQMATEFRRRTGPFRAKKFRTKADLIASAQSHMPLIEKIFSTDSHGADAIMRSHMTESFLQVLAANG
ncbi:MAG: GntR family transcriptional regulator [Roseibium sp.]|nr:GntR family transcriptional regulator [Roseibium sp.]